MQQTPDRRREETDSQDQDDPQITVVCHFGARQEREIICEELRESGLRNWEVTGDE